MAGARTGSFVVDHVIGAFPRERLGTALAATHRAGFGPQCRVLDGARDDTGRLLARAGLHIQGASQPAQDAVLLVVSAPARTNVVAELFHQLGADGVYFAGRRVHVERFGKDADIAGPDIRIDSGDVGA